MRVILLKRLLVTDCVFGTVLDILKSNHKNI